MKRYQSFVNEEVGIRNLKNVVSGYKNCEIWFHKDLDGVCSALAFKYFFKTYYDIDTIDCHIIQYGGQEFAVKSGKDETLKILCDFAHGKPMFNIQSDHHDKQTGADNTKAKYFKPARSNVETISGEISYNDAFTPQDVEMIKTIDSANFLKFDIKPEDVQNSIFKFERTLSGEKNRFMMGFVVNRLLLAYKNKRINCKSLDGQRDHINRNFLECLVLDSSPSLHSIFNNIKNYIHSAKTRDKLGRLASPEDLMKNLSSYIERMKNYKFVEIDGEEVQEYDPENWKHRSSINSGSKISKGVNFDPESKIISQYGGGNMFHPGSYDRYVPFKNFPDANFICIVWPMGLIQVSCNPFREKRLKDINLGEISKEVISTHLDNFKNIFVPLEGIKRELEYSQDWKKMSKEEGSGYGGVGFRSSDLEAFYSDCLYENRNGENIKVEINDEIRKYMDMTYEKMDGTQRSFLEKYKIPLIELITRNSGGHPSITNVQGFSFMKYDKASLKKFYDTEKYTDVMKKFARDFTNNLKGKIKEFESGKNIEYAETKISLKGQDTNESIGHIKTKEIKSYNMKHIKKFNENKIHESKDYINPSPDIYLDWDKYESKDKLKIIIKHLSKNDPQELIRMVNSNEIDPMFENGIIFRESIRRHDIDLLKSLIKNHKGKEIGTIEEVYPIGAFIPICYSSDNHEAAELLAKSYKLFDEKYSIERAKKMILANVSIGGKSKKEDLNHLDRLIKLYQ